MGISLHGSVDASQFEAQLAAAAGLDAAAVVVGVVSQSAGSSNVGFVVVSDEPMAAAAAVSTALETNQVGSGFAGMNKPAEVSVGNQAVSARLAPASRRWAS